MKIFRVVTETDGKTVKAPGVSETERRREEYRYGAETMQEVWDEIAFLRNDPEVELLAIHEEAPAITILKPREPQGDADK